MAEQDHTRLLTVLRWTGLVEGVSTLVLFFVAMPLKYGADMPLAVTYAGSVHGLLFVAYVVLAFAAAVHEAITPRLAVLCVLAAIVPTGPFFVDPKLRRIGSPRDADPPNVEPREAVES